MCGRFSVVQDYEAIQARFQAQLPNEPWTKRYNLAPTDRAPVLPGGSAQFELQTWGFPPPRRAQQRSGAIINARAESVAEKPMFRRAFAERRCLVPADGYYEWRAENKQKLPYRVQIDGGRLFAFAGLWTAEQGAEGASVHYFCIITVEANEATRAIHPRMPAILRQADEQAWLDPAAEPARLQALLQPYPSAATDFYRVSTRINRAGEDDPSLIEPLANPPGEQQGLF
jgi:putative SOS response-associated peptidase YedK